MTKPSSTTKGTDCVARLAKAQVSREALDAELGKLRREEARLARRLRKLQRDAAKIEVVLSKLPLEESVAVGAPYGSIKEGILDALAAHPKGLTVAELTQELRRKLNRNFHSRAPNSALTRLKSSGHVVRDGRRWKHTGSSSDLRMHPSES